MDIMKMHSTNILSENIEYFTSVHLKYGRLKKFKN